MLMNSSRRNAFVTWNKKRKSNLNTNKNLYFCYYEILILYIRGQTIEGEKMKEVDL